VAGNSGIVRVSTVRFAAVRVFATICTDQVGALPQQSVWGFCEEYIGRLDERT
jgi:hypothetical protein